MYKRQAQPVHEMEVITINNTETRTDEIPQVEPEVEVMVSDQPDKTTEGARMESMMMRMMEQMTRNNDSLNKNIESLKENHRDLNKNMESINKNMESLK